MRTMVPLPCQSGPWTEGGIEVAEPWQPADISNFIGASYNIHTRSLLVSSLATYGEIKDTN